MAQTPVQANSTAPDEPTRASRMNRTLLVGIGVIVIIIIIAVILLIKL